MKIREQDLAAIAGLGYTSDEARFLYIVATHSGYFQPRQYIASRGLAWGGGVQRLTNKLESRGHATWREYQGMGGVYHLLSKTIYRRIEKTDLRNRRRHSTEYIHTRLVLLDFILENPQHDYFETETDKLVYFCEERGIPKEALPAKVYPSLSGAPPARRYFVDKYPVFLNNSEGNSPVVSLSYVDPGQASLASFAHHLRQYASLFSWIGDLSFVYIADSSVNVRKAELCFDSLVRQRIGADTVKDIVRFFERRKAWELKQYAQFSGDDVEGLQSARQRYASPELETLYASWTSGEVDDRGLKSKLARKYGSSNISFRTSLVRQKGDGLGNSIHLSNSGSSSSPASAVGGRHTQERLGDEG